MKKCFICGIEKEENEFYTYVKKIKTKFKGTYEKTYFHTKCKQCSNKMTIEYLKNNKEKAYKYNKKYVETHRNELNKKSALRMKENRKTKPEQFNKYINDFKEKNKEFIKENLVKKYNTDENVKNRHKIRSKIREALKRYIKNNKDKFIIELGCNLSEYKVYIENKFTEGMSWNNYTFENWHIDHIIPCCKFDLTKQEEILKCFHYTNTQPLTKQENLSKNRVYI